MTIPTPSLAADAMSLADTTLEAIADFSNARHAALFVREQEQLTLFASRNIEQSVLETIAQTWADHRVALTQGQLIVESDERGSSAVVPILGNDQLMGLLYVNTHEFRFGDDRDRKALIHFARIAAMALSAPPALPIPQAALELYLERTATNDVARQQLLVLLERNEWNLARVARLLSVSRNTIYYRIAKLGIERRHVPKATGPKRQPA
jgi:transcriptional regulator with GAF, ATPase, and Fis domain